MTFASIIVPAYNVEATLTGTLQALHAQTYPSFEIVLVIDGSTDRTIDIARSFLAYGRLRIIEQQNRGLAGARNTGISNAFGAVIGFCDADDIWLPEKLSRHMKHLKRNPDVGVSYSGSALIDDNGRHLRQSQSPKLCGITAAHIFKRNPIGNGSAPVIRRQVFDQIAYRPAHEMQRDWYFDETFRQSEDIECWLRIALTTDWKFEGVRGKLTKYRINNNGLSAGTGRQFQAWQKMVDKLTVIDANFFQTHTSTAKAYQLRYLCRRAIKDLDAARATKLARDWMHTSPRPFLEEPVKSISTWLALQILVRIGPDFIANIFNVQKEPSHAD